MVRMGNMKKRNHLFDTGSKTNPRKSAITKTENPILGEALPEPIVLPVPKIKKYRIKRRFKPFSTSHSHS
jgi:hypothetical protein